MTLKYFSALDTDADLKKRYRALSKRHHPDTSTGNVEVMKEINLEYEYVLNNRTTILQDYIPPQQPSGKQYGQKTETGFDFIVANDFLDAIFEKNKKKQGDKLKKVVFDILKNL